MIEYNIIKILLKKDFYLQYYNIVLSLITDASLKKLVYALDEMHKSLEADGTLEELKIVFFTNYPALKEAEKQIYDAVFSRIAESAADEAIISDYLAKMREKSFAHRMAVELLEVEAGNKPISSVLDEIKSFGDTSISTDEFKFVTDDLNELFNNHANKRGLRWRLKCLNNSLGSLRTGDFGFIFARPETGKTTFLASEISEMCKQADAPVLWFNNEEQGEKVMRRFYQAVLGLTEKELFSDIDKHKAEFSRLTNGNFRLIDEASLTKGYIEKVIKQTQPSLVIFDQIDKIKGFDADRKDLAMGMIYQWAREIAKTYAPVIAVCQADGTGEGVKWLTMGHVADAKTAKQAEADWILGIGKSNDEGFEYMRYLNISKNKLSGDDDSDPSLRHGRFEVVIEPQIARYKDINYGT